MVLLQEVQTQYPYNKHSKEDQRGVSYFSTKVWGVYLSR